MPSSVNDGRNRNELWKDAIDHEIWKFAEQPQTSLSVNDWEGVRLPSNQLEAGIDFTHKLPAQPTATPLVPERGFGDISLGLVARNDA
jgi:hypothetical protein